VWWCGLSRLVAGNRADTRVRPYDDDDSVEMVWHHNEFIYAYRRELMRYLGPPFLNHSASVVQPGLVTCGIVE
jgi:hypothetical protein